MMKRLCQVLLAVLGFVTLCATPSFASGHGLDGSQLSIIWVIPFVCMLLSIALCPLFCPHFWEHHFGKVALFWAAAFLVPCYLVFGAEVAKEQFMHAVISEYMPFIILLFALFTVAGGVRLTGTLVGTPVVNTGLLAVGTILASWMGTTGAAMLLIRPLIRANANRRFRVHSIIFFIFLVANIGGSLSPLGDPPLFLGFLKGVSFFWTTTHVFLLTVIASGILLGVYFLMDCVLYILEKRLNKKIAAGMPEPAFAEGTEPLQTPEAPAKEKLGFDGKINFVLLFFIVLAVLLSGLIPWDYDFAQYGIPYSLKNLLRDIALLVIAGISWIKTTKENRRLNNFTWAPILEVAKLFIGIFISMVPAIAILRAGENGALSSIISAVSNNGEPVNAMYFWCTGLLSSFLDNAPTYLVFFNTAGGDPAQLMGAWAPTLTAISAGAVFMGAVTYIGNAPNFMIKSIADDQGIKMPSFFGYMIWSVGILYPVFFLLTAMFFK